jgi:hypothetical protein
MEKRFVTEESDMYEKSKQQMRLFERIEAALPGFHGYKEKELRRESDRLIRNSLYLKLSEAKNDLKTVFQRLSDRRSFDVLTDMDRLVAKFDRITEQVNHASYGYSGFFDVVKVKEEALDRMIDFDSKLMDDVDNIVKEVGEFKTEVMQKNYDNAKNRVQSLSETVDAFEDTFDKRRGVILGVS